jgi:hypothetical protein
VAGKEKFEVSPNVCVCKSEVGLVVGVGSGWRAIAARSFLFAPEGFCCG